MAKMEQRRTILLVEDSPLIREETSLALRKHGYNVIEADDGAVGVERYKENCSIIDVIVSDLEMPNMDGLELAQYNYENNFLPFVVYTSVDDSKSALKFLEYGVHDYIEKPYKEEQLLSIINNAINRWSVHKEFEEDETLFAGNLESIKFLSRRQELCHANSWIMNKISRFFDEHECDRFMNFLDEVLYNAHEHGNLGITEEEKTHLIQSGKFLKEVSRLEKRCRSEIKISVSILSNQVAVSVSDEGKGFDFGRYLSMTEEDILERICLPNGRGICMVQKYFDSVDYIDNGSTVLLMKRFA